MSTPSLSSVQTSQSRPPSVPSRPPPPVKESGFTMGKLSGGWGKGNQVGEYLKGLTETNATIGKEAVMVNETNKVNNSLVTNLFMIRIKCFLSRFNES